MEWTLFRHNICEKKLCQSYDKFNIIFLLYENIRKRIGVCDLKSDLEFKLWVWKCVKYIFLTKKYVKYLKKEFYQSIN